MSAFQLPAKGVLYVSAVAASEEAMEDSGKSKATIPTPAQLDDWRKIAARASTETDPDKLVSLVQELCEILQKRDAAHKRDEPARSEHD